MTLIDRPGRPLPRLAWLVLPVLLVGWAALVSAQDPKTKGGPPPAPAKADAKGKDAPAPEAESDAEKAAVDTSAAKGAGLEERYKDPRVDAALANTFPELSPNTRKTTKADNDRILAAARGSGGDPKALADYVKAQVTQLTSRRNIDAMLQPASAPDAGRAVNAIEEAGANLVNPLVEANAANPPNTAFRSNYTKELVAVAPNVLKNHLYARLMLMVALSRSQDPAAVDQLVKVLDDPNQVLSVKLLAAVGLANIAQGGKVDVTPAEAARAAKALAGFLDREKDAFWPARLRAVEALGAIRQAESTVRTQKADIGDLLLGVLSDPDERPEVRAQAAWALGMLKPFQNIKFNFGLVAYHMGLAAADIAEQLVEVQRESDARASRLADALIQIALGFAGDTTIRGAGLLRNEHANLAPHRTAAQEIANRVKAVAGAAVDLTEAPSARKDQAREALTGRIEELRSQLTQNPPAELSLYPEGPQFPAERIAEAPAEEPVGDQGEPAGRSR